MPIDTKDLALESHDISQELDVSNINAHSMCLHGSLNLIDNSLSGSFNSKNFLHLNNMICGGTVEVNTRSRHHVFKSVPFHKQLKLALVFLPFVYHGPINLRDAFNYHVW